VINRQNWIDTKEYLAYCERIGRDPETVKRIRGLLRHLLNWAGETPLSKARNIDPSFPVYLRTARLDGKAKRLGASSMKKACEYSRLFFNYIRGEHLQRYKLITTSWIKTISPGTHSGMHSEYHEHEFWEIEQVRKIAALEPRNLTEQRDRAAVCFLFLSAMRAQAFVSLPVEALDLRRKTVKQLPELGVHTKNGKAAKTQLLRIPDLLAVVQEWDDLVRGAGAELWYPRIDRWHRFVALDRDLRWLTRTEILAKGIKKLCARAGMPYLSPHKLRHGHTVYMMRKVNSVRDLKSLSQNLMHAHMGITDGIYGRLENRDLESTYDTYGERE
jgi:site-specific recombinase XerC